MFARMGKVEAQAAAEKAQRDRLRGRFLGVLREADLSSDQRAAVTSSLLAAVDIELRREGE